MAPIFMLACILCASYVLAIVTTFYRAYHDIVKDGKFVYHLQDLHKVYGPVLHFSTVDAYHDIYTRGSTFGKSRSLYNAFPFPEASGTYLDMNKARERRGIIHPLFSRRSILKLENVVQTNVDHLVSRLQSFSRKGQIDMNQAIRSVTMDIISSYCFANLSHPFLVWLDQKKVFESQIETYMKDDSELQLVEHETIYHHLLAPQKGSSAFNLITAGSETVAGACTVGISHALRKPSIVRRLVDELREAWPVHDMHVSYTVLEKLPYLTAFIKECLRCSHGVVTPLPRIVGPEDASIGGYYVPRGTIVEMSWVREPGQNLAWCELYLILGNLFRKFDFTICDASNDDYTQFRELFVPSWDCKSLQTKVRAI
ncbi:hypothetical protein MPER_11569 [Moniliophthora perniciosa FA553]|nr:hypothetical protein MPER_11569 [Moniliophthora perniciosa FA553]